METLDNKIIEKFNKLTDELDKESKRKVHYNSISNFIYYLIYHPELNNKKNKKLQKLREIEIKKQLLDYMESIPIDNLTEENSLYFYKKYLFKIGNFMMEYYNFSSQGGKLKTLDFLITIVIGITVDICIYSIWNKITFITLLFVCLFFIRFYIKYKSKRLYGFMW